VKPIPVVGLVDLPAAPAETATAPRLWMRALSFAALAFYGTERWGQLMRDPPGGRLAGLAGLAVALVVLVPLARSRTGGWPVLARRLLNALICAVAGIGALAIAGLRWEWVTHARLAVSARAVGHGLGSLGGVLVPYLGHGYSIRLVMMLGVAVLLLDAAAALAYAGRVIGDGRRAAAALPLIALAIVPATLVPPASAALQGLVLFGLLALFVWGERIPRGGVGAAVGVACAAGVTAVIIAPRITSSQAWVDYRAWAGGGGAGAASIDHFAWNQSYGPLNWPQDGRVVLTVHARTGEYWKAEDLTRFTGTDWVAADDGPEPALPGPSAAVRRRYTQTVSVALGDIATRDVIGGSGVSARPQIAGGVAPGAVPGTWIARRELAPGAAYTIRSYSPQPPPAALARAGADPWRALTPDLSLTLPEGAGGHPALASITFPAFHRPLAAATAAELADSPYAPAVTLARRLAARAATPYAFVASVQAFLDDGRYTYDQSTTPSRDPLLSFLFATRRGYCQQFSGAMALLLRMGGMPARVAAGFTPGLRDRGAGTWTVTDIDAHAWVEAWFAGYGWVRFDPTPSSDPALGGDGKPAVDAPHAGSPAQERALLLAAARRKRAGKPAAAPRPGAAVHHDAAAGARHAGGTWGWPWIGGGALLAAALALGVGAGLTRRAHPRGDPLVELERALARTGRPLRDGVTLAVLERRFADSPEAAGYIRALRLRRYSDGGAVPTPAGRRAVRTELRAGLGHAGRLRALWALPPRPPIRPR
jgi:transglutaminase-like putative cysteine protease